MLQLSDRGGFPASLRLLLFRESHQQHVFHSKVDVGKQLSSSCIKMDHLFINQLQLILLTTHM